MPLALYLVSKTCDYPPVSRSGAASTPGSSWRQARVVRRSGCEPHRRGRRRQHGRDPGRGRLHGPRERQDRRCAACSSTSADGRTACDAHRPERRPGRPTPSLHHHLGRRRRHPLPPRHRRWPRPAHRPLRTGLHLRAAAFRPAELRCDPCLPGPHLGLDRSGTGLGHRPRPRPPRRAGPRGPPADPHLGISREPAPGGSPVRQGAAPGSSSSRSSRDRPTSRSSPMASRSSPAAKAASAPTRTPPPRKTPPPNRGA